MLTPFEVLVYRHRSHDFKGYTTKETARELRISTSTVKRTLRTIEAKHPELFPILTRMQAKCYRAYMNEGRPVAEIAQELGITEGVVYEHLAAAKKAGAYFPHQKVKILTYEQYMDNEVVEKF
jgi:DNA-binding CsgD family transcriptional regulator